MDPIEFNNLEKKVVGSGPVKTVGEYYIDADYGSELWPNKKATETALLQFGKLVPKHKDLPEFIFRWDHGQERVDVGIHVNYKSEKRLWDREGFSGHHPIRLDKEGHRYKIEIRIPKSALLDSVFRDMTTDPVNVNEKVVERKDCNVWHFAHLYAKPLDLPNTKSLILISPPTYLLPFEPWKNLISDGQYKSLDWWRDYNNLKHDFIRSIKEVTLEGTVNALCALHQVLARRRDMVPMLVRRGWFPLGSWVPDYVFDAIKNNCLPGTFVVQTVLFAVPVGEKQFPEKVGDIKPVVSGYTCKREFIEFIGSL